MTPSGSPASCGGIAKGLHRLQHPVLPLARIVQLLYLTGPFTSLDEVMEQLNEPVETNGALYLDPRATLAPYLTVLRQLESVKGGTAGDSGLPRILDEQFAPLDLLSSLEGWMGQQILTMELEKINSLMCGPTRCTHCCTGPDHHRRNPAGPGADREFFEIPLADHEIDLFGLPRIDNSRSRALTALDEPPLSRNGKPFFANGAALYHWRTGWSMILPVRSVCPHLDHDTGACVIYEERPDVCRRPPIFPYLLERCPDSDAGAADSVQPAYTLQRKLLAVWDCPYVRNWKKAIAAYGEMCDLEPVFRENKV